MGALLRTLENAKQASKFAETQAVRATREITKPLVHFFDIPCPPRQRVLCPATTTDTKYVTCVHCLAVIDMRAITADPATVPVIPPVIPSLGTKRAVAPDRTPEQIEANRRRHLAEKRAFVDMLCVRDDGPYSLARRSAVLAAFEAYPGLVEGHVAPLQLVLRLYEQNMRRYEHRRQSGLQPTEEARVEARRFALRLWNDSSTESAVVAALDNYNRVRLTEHT